MMGGCHCLVQLSSEQALHPGLGHPAASEELELAEEEGHSQTLDLIQEHITSIQVYIIYVHRVDYNIHCCLSPGQERWVGSWQRSWHQKPGDCWLCVTLSPPPLR